MPNMQQSNAKYAAQSALCAYLALSIVDYGIV